MNHNKTTPLKMMKALTLPCFLPVKFDIISFQEFKVVFSSIMCRIKEFVFEKKN